MNEIKKLQVKETVLFAINNIPQADQATLEAFLDLVNATGTFGAMSHEQILTKMHLTLKYVPDACVHSLLILADLLDIQITNSPLSLNASPTWLVTPNTSKAKTIPTYSETQQ